MTSGAVMKSFLANMVTPILGGCPSLSRGSSRSGRHDKSRNGRSRGDSCRRGDSGTSACLRPTYSWAVGHAQLWWLGYKQKAHLSGRGQERKKEGGLVYCGTVGCGWPELSNGWRSVETRPLFIIFFLVEDYKVGARTTESACNWMKCQAQIFKTQNILKKKIEERRYLLMVGTNLHHHT
jgi:hypothetical protein